MKLYDAIAAAEDLVHKQYVDTVNNLKVSKSGDVMTGDLTVASTLIAIVSPGTAAMILDRGSSANFAQFEFRTAGVQNIALGIGPSGKFQCYLLQLDDLAYSIDLATGLMTVISDPVAPLGIATKQYADNRIAVQTSQPTNGAEIWIDTDEPDPLDTLSLQVASLTARIEALEARLA